MKKERAIRMTTARKTMKEREREDNRERGCRCC